MISLIPQVNYLLPLFYMITDPKVMSSHQLERLENIVSPCLLVH